MSSPPQRRDLVLLAVLAVDAALLAVLELFYLPLRLDGLILPRLDDLPLPLTALVAAVTTPLLVMQAAKLTSSRRLGAVPLVVWLLMLLVLGVQGPGGDAVLLTDWRSLVLLAGGAFPAAITLGRLSTART